MASNSFKLNTNGIMGNIADKINQIGDKEQQNFRMIPINLLVANEKNKYGIREIDELAETIKDVGLLQNLLVEPTENGKYKIIAGHRRFAALKKLNYEKVPCQVRSDLDDIDSEIALHRANDFRELTATEKAEKVARLEELYKLKKQRGEKVDGKIRDKIGKDMNLSGMQVQRLKNIHYKLIPELKELLDKNQITMANASDLSLLQEEQQKIAYNFLIANVNASKEEIESLKETLKNKDEKNQELDKTNQELNMNVIKLKGIVNEKDKKLNDISNSIEETKTKLQEEISKKVSDELKEKHEQDIKNLEIELNKQKDEKAKIESERNSIIQEKNKKDKELEEIKSSNKNIEEDIKVNAEIKVLIKSLEKTSNELIDFLNHKNVSQENIKLLKNYKENINKLIK